MVRRTSSRIGSTSRNVVTSAILLLCFLAYVRAEQDKHPHKHDVKKEVEALEQKWRTAQLSGDIATMDRMLAEDFIGISMSGEVNTKAQHAKQTAGTDAHRPGRYEGEAG